jgi:hypothetical protein
LGDDVGLLDLVERLRAHRRTRDRADGYFDARGSDVLPTVGEAFCDAEINAVTGGGIGALQLEAFLVRDARNLHDRGAVVVQARDGRRLAYLSQEAAATYAPALDHLGADALVTADAMRRSRGHHWTLTVRCDRALLDELCEQAAGRARSAGGGDDVSGPGAGREHRSA